MLQSSFFPISLIVSTPVSEVPMTVTLSIEEVSVRMSKIGIDVRIDSFVGISEASPRTVF